ncbi:MAG: type I-C CRISPR-associated protein Cas8c/Csd1 [Solidesulfovibrio sp.]
MLQALMAYAREQLADSEPGFTTREVRWRIELAGDGRFLNVVPLGEGRKGAMLPRCPDMHGMQSGGKAHFLIESAQFLALLFKNNEKPENIEKANVRHSVYVTFLQEAGKTIAGLRPIAVALSDPANLETIRATLAASQAKPSDWVDWSVEGYDPREDAAVQAWWRSWREADLTSEDGGASHGKVKRSKKSHGAEGMLCLLTGDTVTPLLTQPKIIGLSGVGGIAMGDVMVGFDKAAFASYGLEQSANAAMGAQAVQQYVDGLNHLIQGQSQKLAGALVVHWFKERVPPEDDLIALLERWDTKERIEAGALLAARRLLGSIRSGQRPDLGRNRYNTMTLSGAGGRVMVRDWMEGPFEELAANIEAWFSHISIVHDRGTKLAREPRFFEVCLSLVRNDRNRSITENLKQLPSPLAATLWKVAVKRNAIPQAVLALAVARFHSDLMRGEQFIPARVGLLRTYFIRKRKGGEDSMSAYLNPDHPEPAYHCGRLLAVLASLQRAALGDVGAGIVQRYYAAASQTPGLQFGRLITNSRNHLGKLTVKLAWWYEQQIADVMTKLGDSIPRILDLEGQGLFALGYYQQLASLRAGKKDSDSDQPQDEQPQSEQGN